MSFNQLSVIVAAQNLASAEFSKVASDAGLMASQITGTSNSVSVLGTEFAQTGSQAQSMSNGVQETSQSLKEVGATAETTNIKMSTLARGFSTVASFGSAVMVLAGDMGLVDKQTSKWVSTVLAVITVVSTFTRLQSFATLLTQGHTASIAINTSAQGANAVATTGNSLAQNVYAAACGFAAAAETALNISHATFLALTGVGIAVIIAAAAAVAYFASQMNSATASVKTFNSTATETPSRVRGIQRAGEQALSRRGIE